MASLNHSPIVVNSLYKRAMFLFSLVIMYNKFMLKFLKALSFTLFVFGLLGWIYIVINATFHPQTLPLQLTHFAPYPREDTFGEISFIVSLVSFFIWNLIRYTDKK